MEFDATLALRMVKSRLNRMQSDTSLDEYLTLRIQGVVEEYSDKGAVMDSGSPRDLMLVVDETVWAYQNRDTGADVPEWLKLQRVERWLHE